MRLAYLLTTLGIGGAERQALMLAERMEARGHSVLLMILQARRQNQWPTTLQTVYLDLRQTPLARFAALTRAVRILRAWQPGLIHSHTFPANMAARMLHLALPHTRVLATIHNVHEGGWRRSLAYRLTDPLSAAATAVSEAVAAHAIATRQVPRPKLRVLVNGIDTEVFQPNPQRRCAERARMNVADEFVWLAAGRVVPAKDYPNLLRAFARVRAVQPEAQLWIAGEAAQGAVERICQEAGDPDSAIPVRWLGLRRDLPALMDAADAFVLASAWEGMPLVVGEAMAMERPVVATDVGGVRELQGEAGTRVEAHSAPALAEAMLALMQLSHEERQAQGRRARQRIQERFSMDAMAARWEEFYRTLAHPSGKISA
jgi:glycosyltransferase involved in cell wall biosynthesis